MLIELLQYARHNTKHSTRIISFKSHKYLLSIKIFLLHEVILNVGSKPTCFVTISQEPCKRGCENYFHFNNEEAEDQKR